MPGRFAEGPRSPGFILPASAVSEQENCGGCKNHKINHRKLTIYISTSQNPTSKTPLEYFTLRRRLHCVPPIHEKPIKKSNQQQNNSHQTTSSQHRSSLVLHLPPDPLVQLSIAASSGSVRGSRSSRLETIRLPSQTIQPPDVTISSLLLHLGATGWPIHAVSSHGWGIVPCRA